MPVLTLINRAGECVVGTGKSAIEQYPVLATKKELQWFLGLVGYYILTMVASLTDFLKGKAKYIW